ncbi:MAG: hypothetical protein JOY78_10965, partial [Pseudonocardia sp.]|nr:hypothetical protein [Pseudonocardia sp.]
MTGSRVAKAPGQQAKARVKGAATPGARARSADASTLERGEGAGQDSASREADLLADFESRKQRGERFTIAEFCWAHGYATAKGIRRFARLRAALHAYCGGAPGHVQQPD